MKPLFSLILSATLVATLAGCNQAEKAADEGATSTSETATQTTQGTPAATLAEVNQAAGKDVVQGQRVRVETTKGSFTIVTFPEAAPKTVENFLNLAGSGFYDGVTFHRVIPGFVAQGGDPLSKTLPVGDPRIGTGGSDKTIPGEFNSGLKHLAGSVAMARSQDPNSASSQFYIAYQPLPSLDNNYAVFGHVVEGFDVVQKINPTERDGAPITEPAPDKIIKMEVQK